MTTNGVMLILSLALLVLMQLVQVQLITMKGGLGYAMGPRDKPLETGLFGSRLQRAKVNLIENLALFAPLSVLAETMQVNHAIVAWGAVIFFVARIVHVITYTGGIAGVRTLSWLAGVIGCVLIAIALLGWA